MRKIDGQFYHILSAQRKAIIITWLKTSEPKASQKLFHPWSSKSWGVPIQYSFKNRHWNVHQTATSHSSQFVIVCPFLSQGSEYRCLLLHCNNPSLPHSQEGIFFLLSLCFKYSGKNSYRYTYVRPLLGCGQFNASFCSFIALLKNFPAFSQRSYIRNRPNYFKHRTDLEMKIQISILE